MAQRGKLILIVGSTGSGKGTLMKHALVRFPMILSPHSYTTRLRRADTIENAHYNFISVEEFREKIGRDEFLEWAEFSGNLYGTLRLEVEQGLTEGRVMFKEMEVQGVRQVRDKIAADELITVFIDGGSWDELRQRALARGPMDDADMEQRRLRYEDELTFMPEADVVVRNRDGRYAEAEAAFEEVIAQSVRDAEGA